MPLFLPKEIKREILLAAAVLLLSPFAGAQAKATIQKPKMLTVTGGRCLLKADGTLGVNIGPNVSMPVLALTIGPGAFMADQLHANKAKFTGPGKYANEIIAVYLGKTALEDSYMGLGTVTVAADGKSGKFALNDGKAAGTFDCGAPPAKQ
jgi:hypothetical protein